ncbi:hypothetical protein GQ43DRAFT_303738 [Delitschia confertaspora ATCC 74209]|uniref:Uncharacterized protein n=1 Tax=Delitschia confertaspora ATCC 74209 TaxID=1513339 RepID=A0A9P4JNQ4_9PLEO|nr:hypothetical protein GQ43DRAFT_303738 [Delitschia confertaspora ATCC 74209]
MHGVFCNSSDEPAHKILEMQTGALTPGCSKLLIYDHIIPQGGSSGPHMTTYDMTMMILVAG